MLAVQRGPCCERWRRSFSDFVSIPAGDRHGAHLLIRDDTSGEFSPANTRWRVAARYRWRRNVPASARGLIQIGTLPPDYRQKWFMASRRRRLSNIEVAGIATIVLSVAAVLAVVLCVRLVNAAGRTSRSLATP